MRPGRAADHSPLLVPRSWKSTAITLPTLWATPGLLTGKQCCSTDFYLLSILHFLLLSMQFLQILPSCVFSEIVRFPSISRRSSQPASCDQSQYLIQVFFFKIPQKFSESTRHSYIVQQTLTSIS